MDTKVENRAGGMADLWLIERFSSNKQFLVPSSYTSPRKSYYIFERTDFSLDRGFSCEALAMACVYAERRRITK